MTILVTDPTVPLISGLVAVREIDSWGVRGDAIPQGNGIPSMIGPSVDLPADAAVEFRFEVLAHTFPANTLFVYDDGSFTIAPSCPDGVYTVTGRLWADQIAQSPLVTHTFLIGASGAINISATLDPFIGNMSLLVPPSPQITIAASMDVFASVVNLSTAPSMTIAASMDSFVSLVSLRGGLPGTLPAVLSTDRQYIVNSDAHLDAYTIDHEYALLWQKDPDSTLDYSVDWAKWMTPGDVITDLYVLNTEGISVVAQGIVGDTVTACLIGGGGALGTEQRCTMRIKTAAGLVDERTIRLLMRSL